MIRKRGIYERYKYEKGSKKETQIGYNWVNMEAVNEEIIFLIDDYLNIDRKSVV